MTADNASELLDVVIVGFDVNDDGTILAGLGRVFKMDEARGRRLLDNLPSTVARQVPEVRARYLLRALQMIDARVEMRDADGNAVTLEQQAVRTPTPAPAPARPPDRARPKPKQDPEPAHIPVPKLGPADPAPAPPASPSPATEAALRLPTAPTALSAPTAPQTASPQDVSLPRASRTTLSEGQPIPPALAAQLAVTERPLLPPPSAATAQFDAGDRGAPGAGAATPARREEPIAEPMPLSDEPLADPGESMVGGWGGLGARDPSYISSPSPVAASPAIPAPRLAPLPEPETTPIDDVASERAFQLDPMGVTAASQDRQLAGRAPDPLAMTAPHLTGDGRAPGKPGFDPLVMTVPRPAPRDRGAADPLAMTAPQLAPRDISAPDPLAMTAPQPVRPPPEAGRSSDDSLESLETGKSRADAEQDPATMGAVRRARGQALPGFTHGGLAAASSPAVERNDGNIALQADDDDRLSLAPRDEVDTASRDHQPMQVLTDYEQPSRESVDGYRHPAARSGEVPRADSALAAAAHPGYRPVQRKAHDTRPFWSTLGEGMMLPFMGTGTGWIIAIALWSAVVGAVSILFDVVPGTLGTIVAGLCTVWLSGSVVAFAADYYRTCVWAVLGRRDAPSERPALSQVYGEYLGSAVHFVFFGLFAFMPLIGWSFLRLGDDDGSMRAFVTSPITLVLLAAPNLYFPMALATAALGNRASAIWHVGFGISALRRAPLEYAFILVISMGASMLAATPLVIAGTLLELQGWFFLATLGFPLAIGSGIQGGLMGHLMRARPETFGE